MRMSGRFLAAVFLAGLTAVPAIANEGPAAAVDPVLTAPRKAHKVLASMAGIWSFTSKVRSAAGAEPILTSGVSSNRMILGGRFLEQKISSQAQVIEGTRVIGYDNLKGEYQTFVIDSLRTRILFMSGTYDPGARTLRFSGSISVPSTGEAERKARSETVLLDPEHFNVIFYMNGPDGKEYKAVETSYVLQKRKTEASPKEEKKNPKKKGEKK